MSFVLWSSRSPLPPPIRQCLRTRADIYSAGAGDRLAALAKAGWPHFGRCPRHRLRSPRPRFRTQLRIGRKQPARVPVSVSQAGSVDSRWHRAPGSIVLLPCSGTIPSPTGAEAVVPHFSEKRRIGDRKAGPRNNDSHRMQATPARGGSWPSWAAGTRRPETLFAVEGHRRAIEDSFGTAPNDLGLDHSESRSWHGWHRPTERGIAACHAGRRRRHRPVAPLRDRLDAAFHEPVAVARDGVGRDAARVARFTSSARPSQGWPVATNDNGKFRQGRQLVSFESLIRYAIQLLNVQKSSPKEPIL